MGCVAWFVDPWGVCVTLTSLSLLDSWPVLLDDFHTRALSDYCLPCIAPFPALVSEPSGSTVSGGESSGCDQETCAVSTAVQRRASPKALQASTNRCFSTRTTRHHGGSEMSAEGGNIFIRARSYKERKSSLCNPMSTEERNNSLNLRNSNIDATQCVQ